MKKIRFVISGGLGNQLFQYVAYLYVLAKYPQYQCWMDFWHYRFDNFHNGIEIQKILKTEDESRIRNVNNSQKVLGRWNQCKPYFSNIDAGWHKLIGYKTFYDADILTPDLLDNVINNNSKISLGGFFQNSLFAEAVKDDIRIRFFANLNQKNSSFIKSLGQYNLVSLHVRRGDYLAITKYDVFNGMNYYYNAIAYLKEREENLHFVIFSDDIDWVKENLNIDCCSYVNWNAGQDSYQDMVLMSLCNHNIIANSSFSWWGAYLNPNKDKIVIAPRIWFKGKASSLVVPKEWILIDN